VEIWTQAALNSGGCDTFFGTVLVRSGNREISAAFSDVPGEIVPRGDWD